MNESILEVIHESAKSLHKIGVVDSITMKEFDELCLPEVNEK